MPPLVTIMLFAAFGGIASAAFAVGFLWLREEQSAHLLPHLVSFATGALLGAACLALLPEAIKSAGPMRAGNVGLALLAGLGFFFIVEKLVLWWHSQSHAHEQARVQASGVLVLVGDSIHNALDGVLIAAAFLTSPSLGFVTTLAVAAHEIPHRVGDFAILVHAGFSRARALWLNLATGLASPLGALLAYFVLRQTTAILPYALAFAAAGFLYIALAGLVPDLHRSAEPRASILQVISIVAGVVVIAGAERLAGL
jgi:zinc and cadmium transporter